MKCCDGNHETFTVIGRCVKNCGTPLRQATIYHCGQEVSQECKCGASIEWATTVDTVSTI